MTRSFAALPLILLLACTSGPEEVDPSVFDAGALDPDVGIDAGHTDTGTIASDAGPLDAEPADAEPGDGEPRDGDQADAEPGDADGVDADGGVNDSGPTELVEDFSDPLNEVFTCPDGTAVLPGLLVEHGTQCLGIDGSGCPDARGLPGPGSVDCSDPAHNPFIGAGQCVTDFFSCFDPSGACSDDGAGRFTWENGAVQTIQVDGNGLLLRSEFVASTSTIPCVVGLPESPGGTRVIYTQR